MAEGMGNDSRVFLLHRVRGVRYHAYGVGDDAGSVEVGKAAVCRACEMDSWPATEEPCKSCPVRRG